MIPGSVNKKNQAQGKERFSHLREESRGVCPSGHYRRHHKGVREEESDITDTTNMQGSTIRINIENKKKDDDDQATALAILFRSLGEDDHALTDEYESVYDFWANLKKNDAKRDEVTANKYMTRIQTFTFDPEQDTITILWDKLKEHRRKLVNADATQIAYPDRTLLLILIRALPKSYSSTIDTLNIQSSLSMETKLKYVLQKENRLKEDTEEHVNVAYAYSKKHARPSAVQVNQTVTTNKIGPVTAPILRSLKMLSNTR